MRKKIVTAELRELIVFLEKTSKKNNAPFWKDIAKRLSTSRRRRSGVNVSKIDKYSQEGSTVLVPGKVLASGSLTHEVDVAAFRFSIDAERKISSQGSCTDIKSLAEKNPKGTGIIILE
ncbi:MAG: 50S ribosomal protein L18e [Candidatus Micrarchaeota archaeon]